MELRRTVLTAATVAATATGMIAGVGTASAAPAFHHYVALGDSYSAGPLIPAQEATWCFRSNNNYPSWLATKLGLYYTNGAFRDASCSSADTTNMTQPQTAPSASAPFAHEPPQFDALTLDTDLITIGIGGNDYGVFGSLVYNCPGLRASDPTGSPCKDHFTVNGVDTELAALANTERNLEAVVAGARAHSPGAKIVLVGYPRLVPPTGTCPDVIPFADGDYVWADGVERALNAAEATAAANQGATYVDTYGPSLGHDACAGADAWVNGQHTDLFKAASYHPLAAGMQAEANLLDDALTGDTGPDATARATRDVHAPLKPAGPHSAPPSQLSRMAEHLPY